MASAEKTSPSPAPDSDATSGDVKLSVVSLETTAQGLELRLDVDHPTVIASIASALAELVDASGAQRYLRLDITTPDNEAVSVVITPPTLADPDPVDLAEIDPVAHSGSLAAYLEGLLVPKSVLLIGTLLEHLIPILLSEAGLDRLSVGVSPKGQLETIHITVIKLT